MELKYVIPNMEKTFGQLEYAGARIHSGRARREDRRQRRQGRVNDRPGT